MQAWSLSTGQRMKFILMIVPRWQTKSQDFQTRRSILDVLVQRDSSGRRWLFIINVEAHCFYYRRTKPIRCYKDKMIKNYVRYLWTRPVHEVSTTGKDYLSSSKVNGNVQLTGPQLKTSTSWSKEIKMKVNLDDFKEKINWNEQEREWVDIESVDYFNQLMLDAV